MTICFKCGEDKKCIKHHLNYDETDDNNIVDCCRSCHAEIHPKTERKTYETIGTVPYMRMTFYDHMMINVNHQEQIRYHPRTGNLSCCFGFLISNTGDRIHQRRYY